MKRISKYRDGCPYCMDGCSRCMPNPHARALGKLGGQVKSPAKAAAARRNGRLGGAKPKKVKEIKAMTKLQLQRLARERAAKIRAARLKP